MIKSSEYHPFTKFLHWGIVVLVGIQFLTSTLFPEGRRSLTPDVLMSAHMSFGLLILPFVVTMLFMRFYRPVAKLEAETSGLLGAAATAMQYALYLLMVIIPITGWIAESSRGAVVSFFGLVNLPAIVAQGSTLGHTIGRNHSLLAWTVGVLACGHIAAALYHYFVLKDEVLNRMRPFKKTI